MYYCSALLNELKTETAELPYICEQLWSKDKKVDQNKNR